MSGNTTMKPNPFEDDIHDKLAHLRREVARLPKIAPLPYFNKARMLCNVSGLAVFWGMLPKPPAKET